MKKLPIYETSKNATEAQMRLARIRTESRLATFSQLILKKKSDGGKLFVGGERISRNNCIVNGMNEE